MDGRDFLTLALSLAKGTTEAEWRSAASRAYYAAFHVARKILSQCGFTVPRGDRAHAYLWLRISNSKNATVDKAGRDLKAARSDRNWADYDLDRPFIQRTALDQLKLIESVINNMQPIGNEPTKTQITEAIKVYERDVLKEATWQPLAP
jgi:uncharacterized protein (UPF0332 family)